MPLSAYVSGNIVRTLANITWSGAVFVPESSVRLSQRLVAKVGFFAVENIRIEDVMVEAEPEDLDYPHNDKMPIRFAKAKVFLRFESDDSKVRMNRGDIASEDYVTETDSEFCFVQYYDV